MDLEATNVARTHHPGPASSPLPSPRRRGIASALAVSVLAAGLVIAAVPAGARTLAGAPAPIGVLAALALVAGLLARFAGAARPARRPAAVAAGEVERRFGFGAAAVAPGEAAQPFAFAVALGWGTAAGVLVTAAVTCALALARGGRLRAGLLDAARLVVAAAAGGALWQLLSGPGGASTLDLPALAGLAALAALAAALGAVVLVAGALAAVVAAAAGPGSGAAGRAKAAGCAGAAGWAGAGGWVAAALLALAPVAWSVAARHLPLTPLLLPPVAALCLAAGARTGQRQPQELVERERAAAQAAAEAILATVSHELRAPLAVVLGSLETLSARDGELAPEERRELVAMAARQGQRLRRLVGQLLVAARLEQAELEEDREAVIDAIRVVREAERAMEVLHPGRKLRLDASRQALPVRAVPETVLQVVTNLLDNAAKYSPPGTPIGVRARRVGSSAVITVSDAGRGVPPEQRERIFERFTQLGSGEERRGDGVGLGLYIARGLARSLGGDLVLCQDGPGAVGARFELRLPLAGEGAARVVPIPDPAPATPAERPAAPVGSARRR